MKNLNRNLIPTVEIGPVVEELVRERWPHSDGYEVLAEKIGCDPSAIYNIARVTRESADFDLVDKILCGLGRYDLWFGPFQDIYYGADISQEKCRRDGCDVRFVPRLGGRNGPDGRQMYCSRKCRHMQWKHDKGLVKDCRKRNLSTHCRHGHKRTPENQVLRDGYYTCRVCIRERRAEQRKRRSPERREALRAYNRAYYHRRKRADA